MNGLACHPQSMVMAHMFWTMCTDIECGKHKKILCTCYHFKPEHKKINVCSGHRVRMCKVLCLHIKRTAVQVLGAILRLKRNRQMESAVLLSSHMLSSECQVCYSLSTI